MGMAMTRCIVAFGGFRLIIFGFVWRAGGGFCVVGSLNWIFRGKFRLKV